jgi:hypothetical protein
VEEEEEAGFCRGKEGVAVLCGTFDIAREYSRIFFAYSMVLNYDTIDSREISRDRETAVAFTTCSFRSFVGSGSVSKGLGLGFGRLHKTVRLFV